MPPGRDTLGVVHPLEETGPARVRTRALLYGITTATLCALLALSFADAFAPVFGVDAATEVSRADDGTILRVEYPEVTRPALASPFAIEVIKEGGFDGPIEIAVSRPWIEVWDENGFYPTPSSETGDPQFVVWEFDPPDGEVFRFFYDARLEPARQTGVEGRVELRDGGATAAAVAFRTEVRP